MSSVVSEIIEMLNDDIVSHGLLAQCVRQSTGGDADFHYELRRVLEELLSHQVEIGDANNSNPGYVEFVAWRGSIGDRVSRAIDRVAGLTGPDQEFAYWLCLRANVDRFE